MSTPIDRSTPGQYHPAGLIFVRHEALRVMICRQCQHAVWPREAYAHLRGAGHRLTKQAAEQVVADVATWTGLAQHPQSLPLPDQLPAPVPHLPLYDDGMQCARDPEDGCLYVARTMDAMKKHWRTVHGWSAQRTRGPVHHTVRAQAATAIARISKSTMTPDLLPWGCPIPVPAVPRAGYAGAHNLDTSPSHWATEDQLVRI